MAVHLVRGRHGPIGHEQPTNDLDVAAQVGASITRSGRCQVQPSTDGRAIGSVRSDAGSSQSSDSSEKASGAVRSNQPGVNSAARSEAIVS